MPSSASDEPALAELLTGARIVADAHRNAIGTPITRDILAERMRVPTTIADRLLTALGELQPATAATVPARVNGATPALAATANEGALW